MAFQDTDLLLVGRAGGSFRATAQALKTYVEAGDGLTFRGSADLTAAPVINPNPPAVGDLYINTTAGTVDAGWTGAAGSTTAIGDRVLWDGTEWDLVASSQDVGVTDVSVTAPITDTGTAAQPNIGISAATESAPGSAQLAKVAYEGDGSLNTDNASDVLIGAHFDELAGRIQTAAGGGIQNVQGANGLTASVTTGTATVSGIDAGVGTVGVTALSNTVADVATTAATPKAVNDYAVPLDLSTLTELA
jgi:hypothetical protein